MDKANQSIKSVNASLSSMEASATKRAKGATQGIDGMTKIGAPPTLPDFLAEVYLLHHSLTVHESAPNLSERARRGLVYVYMGPEVRLVDPGRMKGPAEFAEV